MPERSQPDPTPQLPPSQHADADAASLRLEDLTQAPQAIDVLRQDFLRERRDAEQAGDELRAAMMDTCTSLCFVLKDLVSKEVSLTPMQSLWVSAAVEVLARSLPPEAESEPAGYHALAVMPVATYVNSLPHHSAPGA